MSRARSLREELGGDIGSLGSYPVVGGIIEIRG